jgi:hypothetical protein
MKMILIGARSATLALKTLLLLTLPAGRYCVTGMPSPAVTGLPSSRRRPSPACQAVGVTGMPSLELRPSLLLPVTGMPSWGLSR